MDRQTEGQLAVALPRFA